MLAVSATAVLIGARSSGSHVIDDRDINSSGRGLRDFHSRPLPDGALILYPAHAVRDCLRTGAARLATGLCLLAAFILHPLMAAYAIGFVIALALISSRRWKTLAVAGAAVMLLGLVASHAGALLGSSPAYRVATVSRDYFFLDKWEWFEIFGLFPPLVAALIYLSRSQFRIRSNYGLIAAVSLYVGCLAMLFAVCFTRTDASFLLARLQVLRSFQIIYILFFLLLGSLLGQYVLGRRWWAWAAGFTAVAALMFAVQLSLYPALKHRGVAMGAQPQSLGPGISLDSPQHPPGRLLCSGSLLPAACAGRYSWLSRHD